MPRPMSQANIDACNLRYLAGVTRYAHKEWVVNEDVSYAPHPEEHRCLRRGDVIIPRTVFCEHGMRTLWLLYQMEPNRSSCIDGYLGRLGWGGVWEQHVRTPEEYERRMRAPVPNSYDFIAPAILNSTPWFQATTSTTDVNITVEGVEQVVEDIGQRIVELEALVGRFNAQHPSGPSVVNGDPPVTITPNPSGGWTVTYNYDGTYRPVSGGFLRGAT